MNARRLFAVAIFVISTQGRTADTPPDGSEELQRQQQRERALRQQLETAPDVRLERPGAPETGRLPKDETPCFVIDRLILKGEGAERFQWALPAAAGDHDSPLGQCLGSAGINLVMKRLQKPHQTGSN